MQNNPSPPESRSLSGGGMVEYKSCKHRSSSSKAGLASGLVSQALVTYSRNTSGRCSRAGRFPLRMYRAILGSCDSLGYSSLYGIFRMATSYVSMAKENTSTRLSYDVCCSWDSKSSGAIQRHEPTPMVISWAEALLDPSGQQRDRPKSATFACGSACRLRIGFVSSTLPLLRSLWRMQGLWLCRYFMPAATSMSILTCCLIHISYAELYRRSKRLPPEQNSDTTRYGGSTVASKH